MGRDLSASGQRSCRMKTKSTGLGARYVGAVQQAHFERVRAMDDHIFLPVGGQCDICGKPRGKYRNHVRCSRIRQARYQVVTA